MWDDSDNMCWLASLSSRQQILSRRMWDTFAVDPNDRIWWGMNMSNTDMNQAESSCREWYSCCSLFRLRIYSWCLWQLPTCHCRISSKLDIKRLIGTCCFPPVEMHILRRKWLYTHRIVVRAWNTSTGFVIEKHTWVCGVGLFSRAEHGPTWRFTPRIRAFGGTVMWFSITKPVDMFQALTTFLCVYSCS